MPSEVDQYTNVSGSLNDSCLILNAPRDVQILVLDITNTFVVPVHMLLSVLSFITNTLVLTTILRSTILRQILQIVFCSLAVTDLLWALLSLAKNIMRMTNERYCFVPESVPFGVLCHVATMGNLAIISRDRYVAVSRPWWYRRHVTRARTLKKVIAVWLFSGVSAGAFYMDRFSPLKREILFIIGRIANSMFYGACILIILSSYFGLFLANKLHKRNISELNNNLRQLLEREKRMASTVALILFVLIFTFLPALIFPVVLSLRYESTFHASLSPFYNLFVTLNGLLNPLINLGRSKDVQQAVFSLIGCHQRRRQTAPSTVGGLQSRSTV